MIRDVEEKDGEKKKIEGRKCRSIKYGGVALSESLLEGFVILCRHSDTQPSRLPRLPNAKLYLEPTNPN